MFTRTLCAITACAVFSIATAVNAVATSVPSSRIASEPKEVLSLEPGQTEASATLPMRPDVCVAMLRLIPGHTASDCVTHFTLKVTGLPGQSKLGVAKMSDSTLAGYGCTGTWYAQMSNFGWIAHVSQRFCIWPGYDVYPAGTDCSNYWSPSAYLTVTWCGGGRRGWVADGGENVSIIQPVPWFPFFIAYGAGQRVSLDANWHVSYSCWNAFC